MSSATADATIAPITNNLKSKRGGRPMREMAAEIGITVGALSQLEAGTIFPAKSTLERLCYVYACDVGDLYTNVPEK